MNKFFNNNCFIVVTDYDICIINNANHNIYYSHNTLKDYQFNIESINNDFIKLSNGMELKRYYIGTYQLEQEVDILYSIYKFMIEYAKAKDDTIIEYWFAHKQSLLSYPTE